MASPARRNRVPTRAEWSAIRLFAMDVDGVLTDGRVIISSDGTEAKAFSVLDGLGLARVRDSGLALAWISGRKSGATTVRAQELRIPHVLQDRKDKREALGELAASLGIPLPACAYMGDDVIDIGAISAAGIGVAVPESSAEVRRAARLVTRRAGGFGAVREVCDLLLASRP